ncbi:metal-dependent transcriptional regulator [Proteiniphilum sp. X52]|uniref:metal-dependent transcriptional regulator n=1 Tax=Proteiniphilum sp. X52 TaxID=2382159 RepID=UPI000F0A1382|nr:metal-dependent transcriptional regulator [Proteiniphilum sp. X52]RNC63514.1 metal-dependent transcriptional regulator [Proteiniphilum sp. X52]
MAFQTKEDYLKNMYMIDEEMGIISLSELGRRLRVSIPTVNSMVKKLHHGGWVIYEKYQPVTLTDKGKREAALIVRKHRIVEMFLVNKMNFGWEEVHDIAEQIEHVNSEIFFERMDEMLGNPSSDPHGSPIPNQNGIITPKKYMRLSDARNGSVVILRRLHSDDRDLLNYLNEKRISLHTTFIIENIEPFDKSISIRYNEGARATLSKEVCDMLLVEAASSRDIPLPGEARTR